MKRMLTLAAAILFSAWALSAPARVSAIECHSGDPEGPAGVSTMDIQCGGGHDCVIEVCEGCIECSCVEDGGNAYCTYCDFAYCTMVTLGCA